MSEQHVPSQFDKDCTRLEIITTCVGFDDILAETLAENHAECDHMIVVTSYGDTKTRNLCDKLSVTCVPTDLFHKGGRKFNKGAAINAGMGYFQSDGWRLHLDSDIMLPRGFHKTLFTRSYLERDCIYGADRFDVIGVDELAQYRKAQLHFPQHTYRSGTSPVYGGAFNQKIPTASSSRFVSDLDGYLPIGFFQLWNAQSQINYYPYSSGTAAHDDLLFARLWPEGKRRLLPSVFVGHLTSEPPCYGRNWEGRKSPRIDEK